MLALHSGVFVQNNILIAAGLQCNAAHKEADLVVIVQAGPQLLGKLVGIVRVMATRSGSPAKLGMGAPFLT